MNRKEQYRLARRQVRRKRSFYIHLGVMVAVCLPIVVVAGFDSPNPWEALPLPIMWGIPLLIHYVVVFGLPFGGLGGSEWQKRQLEREMAKLEPEVIEEDFEEFEELDLNEPVVRREKPYRDFV